MDIQPTEGPNVPEKSVSKETPEIHDGRERADRKSSVRVTAGEDGKWSQLKQKRPRNRLKKISLPLPHLDYQIW
jgi:hypothetical protein